MKSLYCDTETGGLPKEGLAHSEIGLTEVAFVLTDESFKILDTYQSYIKPAYKPNLLYSKGSFEKTELSLEILEEQGKDIKTVAKEVYQKFKGSNAIFKAFNLSFDFGFIYAHLVEIGGLELNKIIAHTKYPKMPIMADVQQTYMNAQRISTNTKLKDALPKYNITLKNSHSALEDTKVLPLLEEKIFSSQVTEDDFEIYKQQYNLEF